MTEYRRDIDGLRALAVLPVVLFHFGATFIPGGFTGVDIFFVISGYLISGTLVADLERGRFSIIDFYWRRFRRIMPALTVVLVVSTLAAFLILLPPDFAEYCASLVASATFWSNIYFWKTTNYFAIEGALRPLLHTWSLSVEEQYYIFAPFLVWIIHRWLGGRWMLSLAPIIIGSFAISVLATSAAPTAGFYLLPTRVWELMLGALVRLHRFPAPRSRAAAESVGLAGLGLCAYGFFCLSETDAFPGLNALYPCVGAVLLIQAGRGAADGGHMSIVTRFLVLKPMVWIGLISYSLYLVHWPISAFAHYLSMDEVSAALSVTMVVASFALATMSWRFVEQPFRRNERLGRPKLVFALSGATISVLVAIGLTGTMLNGVPSRFPNYRPESIEVGNWNWGTCFNLGGDPLENWNAETCQLTKTHRTRVLLWGDSFAAHYVPGLTAGGVNSIGADVVQYTYAGCPPDLSYFSYARRSCSDFNHNALRFIKELDIEAVVLSARWVDYENRGFEGLQQTVDRIRALGVAVTVIGQSPQFVTDIRKLDYYIRQRGSSDQAWKFAMDPEINTELKKYTLGADFIDPLTRLCVGDICAYAGPEGYYFSDYGHFSPAGARRAIELYWPRFGAQAKAQESGGWNF